MDEQWRCGCFLRDEIRNVPVGPWLAMAEGVWVVVVGGRMEWWLWYPIEAVVSTRLCMLELV